MGNKIGVIGILPKKFVKNLHFKTDEDALREKGYNFYPGSGKYISPFRETDTMYRTGLDENALYIESFQSKEAKEQERARVRKLKTELEGRLRISLEPDAAFYRKRDKDGRVLSSDLPQAQILKLIDGDNIFNLNDPLQAVDFAWLRVHPSIARSLEAFEAGEYPSTTLFYVKDRDVEEDINYKKTLFIDKAKSNLVALSIPRRLKIAALLGLPISEDSGESKVYNELNTFLSQPSIKSGPYIDKNPIDVFNTFLELDPEKLDVKYLVDVVLRNQIYREQKGSGIITEGSSEIASSKEALVEFLLSDAGQQDRLALTQKLSLKKTLV